MSKKISIPITDHTAEGVCTSWYDVSYKLNTEAGYTIMPPLFGDTVEIDNLAASAEYNVHIVRHCCNGAQSAVTEITVTT